MHGSLKVACQVDSMVRREEYRVKMLGNHDAAEQVISETAFGVMCAVLVDQL